MADYKVILPIQHDGKVFVPGEEVSEGDFGDKSFFDALVSAGAVGPTEEVVVTEDDEPPANYADPDLRLGSGDPNAPGSAVLDLQTSEPRNIPQVAFVQLDPSIAPPMGTTPQKEVADKLAAQQEESDALTIEEAQATRDEEQSTSTEQVVSNLQGGETEAPEPKKTARKAVTPTDEKASSPALKAGRDGNVQ
jgi:hypothetical protein